MFAMVGSRVATQMTDSTQSASTFIKSIKLNMVNWLLNVTNLSGVLVIKLDMFVK